ncbi:DUF3021 domain-containing protein [Haloimpatiens massiliensis]|uniref:DUF3021 domain-containing protein n=1 Tax=Haloimpatiens massiliensis TaxID=1658110 RepID=UPI000C855D5B|nr:DUF3021 domain-containing protein [Haloimpatiens massiliensis]
MSYVKKALLRGFYGITIGVFINQVIFVMMALRGSFPADVSVSIMVSQFVISSLLGFGIAACSVIFEVDNWSLLKQTVVHFILFSFIYFPAAVCGKWMPDNLNGKLIFILIYILIYVCYWFSFKYYWSRKARKINEEIKLRRNKLQ